MKIEEKNDLVIIDDFDFEGFIDKEQGCSICKFNLVYYEDFDAYFLYQSFSICYIFDGRRKIEWQEAKNSKRT
ncbi:hypothetical protein RYX56_14490 [Alkalihalophilus lindianensis]|uniref:Uncharacterized protein n=1 Tax=Alkalihalophilus lindianensis TaxID=1630542 RepID=A0ABU3XCG1_9BACI|nr:hypothetical protein [Alkalihalophilus lindianensis]MDV2685572.1 hypothetical protein [Alkalihalophilus lindianensis]